VVFDSCISVEQMWSSFQVRHLLCTGSSGFALWLFHLLVSNVVLGSYLSLFSTVFG